MPSSVGTSDVLAVGIKHGLAFVGYGVVLPAPPRGNFAGKPSGLTMAAGGMIVMVLGCHLWRLGGGGRGGVRMCVQCPLQQ